MAIRELAKEHHDATVEYLRTEQALRTEAIKPAPDREKVQNLAAKRDIALDRLNSIRDVILRQPRNARASGTL